ncbi:MAG: phosphoethanolamine--lipid A transferase, partial [Pseudomonadales bacterium]|nr:phosphoethanolamine--lipid A transferase [Pseudomonadales bacterium]
IVATVSIVSSKYTTKPVLILMLLLSSLTGYFMDNYGAIVDVSMLQNIVETNLDEAMDLFSLRFLFYFLILGLVPTILIIKAPIFYRALRQELLAKIVSTGVSVGVLVAVLFIFGDSYASFIRAHKPIRYYTNPFSYINAIVHYVKEETADFESADLQVIGEDAVIPSSDTDRELIIMVVGETVRADRFALNGYSRNTNPLLEKEDIISFNHFYSCGTSTAVSVPCMFSVFDHDQYSKSKANSTENILDVLKHAGVNVLWRDNNSNSKGVADRVLYEDFKNPKMNPDCDIECRDMGMLSGLQSYIDSTKSGDILIVLHQMGNHGPAYYKRYPKSYEVFKPTCETNQLERCSKDEIDNTYDNIILYTDYFLSQVIALLKTNSTAFEAAMLYVSDHGESLGENGLYLHGLPYRLAPDAQKHVAALMWFSDSYDIDLSRIKKKASQPLTHDHIFHTLLGLMEIQTRVYDKHLDILGLAEE